MQELFQQVSFLFPLFFWFEEGNVLVKVTFFCFFDSYYAVL